MAPSLSILPISRWYTSICGKGKNRPTDCKLSPAGESAGKQIVHRLGSLGHSALFVAELDRGIEDDAVLLRSRESNAILPAADRDFGELVFRRRLLHSGIVLIRLARLEAETKAELVAAAFEQHAGESNLGFAVLSRRAFRLRKGPL